MTQPLRVPQEPSAKPQAATLKLARTCRECGGALGPHNTSGICSRNAKCHALAMEAYNRRRSEEAKARATRKYGKCSECAGPLGPKNRVGICMQNPTCKKIAKGLHARRVTEEARASRTYRSCLGCGDPLRTRNTTDYCHCKADCMAKSQLQYQRNRRAKMVAERTRIPLRPCNHCREPLKSSNSTDYCVRTVACRNLNASVHRQRRAEANGKVREKRFCECGAELAWNNSTDVCQSNPECRLHSQRLRDRSYSKKKAELRIKTGRQRTCVRCLEPLHTNNITDYCMSNETCRRIHNRLYQQILAERQPHPTCEICGGRLRKSSVYLVCERRAKCRKELVRRRYLAHSGLRRRRKARNHNDPKNHDRVREDPNRRKRKKHVPAVIPTPTRILPKEFAEFAGISPDSVYRYCRQPPPALGRRIKTWPETRPPGSRKPFLCGRADANKIAAYEANSIGSPGSLEHGGVYKWGVERFTFTPNQAECYEVWLRAKQAGSPWLKDEYVLETAGLEGTKRLKYDVFRVRENGKLVPHPAWGKMIVQGNGPGIHGIADPRPSAR